MFRRSQRNFLHGFTLVELLVSLTILGILATMAIPSFVDVSERRRVVGAGDNLLASMRFAQSESLKRNTRVHLVLQSGSNWSYNVCLTTDCSGATDPLRATVGTDYRGTSLAVNTSPLSFDPKRGTLVQAPAATTAMLSVTLNGKNVGVQVDPNSQFQLCSTADTGGYAACPVAP